MGKYILSMASLGLLIFALAGCGNTQKNDLPDSKAQSNTAASKFQMPEEGYYSNDSETGILNFSGKDDRGNDIKADIENKGDHLEVTATQSSHEDIVGTTQIFSQTDEYQ